MEEQRSGRPHSIEPDIYAFENRGWLYVPQLLSADQAAMLQELAIKLAKESDMTPTGEQPAGQEFVGNASKMRKKLIMHDEPIKYASEFWEIASSPKLVNLAKRYIGTPEIKYIRSEIFEKGTVVEGMGDETDLHQDMPYMPIDRSGGLTIWISLCNIPPEMGSLHFVDGSHRFGVLGRDGIPGFKPDLIQSLRERDAWQLSGPVSMSAGDATIHHDLMVHGAPRNLSNQHRFAFAVSYIRADSLYTGAPWRHTEGLGLVPMQRLDHERFPTL